MIDAYAGAAQYHDLLYAERTAARVRELVAAVGAEISHGILDLGAGTGAAIAEVAADLPDLPIIAVEPSQGMRTALFARLAADPALRARTTVLPGTAERLDLTGVADLVLCLDTSQAFPPPYRPDIWERLHRALVPGGVLLLDVPERDEPTEWPTVETGRTTVGTLTLIGSVRGEPAGQRQWTEARYTLLDADGEVVAEDMRELYAWPVSADELRAELTEAGFTLKDDIVAADRTFLQARRG